MLQHPLKYTCIIAFKFRFRLSTLNSITVRMTVSNSFPCAPRQTETFCHLAVYGAGGFLRGTRLERELEFVLLRYPKKSSGLFSLDFFDRCHSLWSLLPPLAALPSLPLKPTS